MNISISQENYLKSILKLEASEGVATNQALAQNMESTPAAVTGMLRKLMKEGLIEYEAYHGARLTESGKHHALLTIRKHRLWEVFLVEKLNFPWDSVHSLAEELEHVGDEAFVNRLDEFLNHPVFDPHGDPIPDAKGVMRERPNLVPSNVAEVGDSFVVCGVVDSSSEFLRHLNQLGVKLGKSFQVYKRYAFDGSTEWKGNQGRLVTLSSHVSEKILIQLQS